MAKKPSASVDPDAQYRVVLTRTVKVGSAVLRPRNENIVKGKLIETLGDAVESYEKV